MYNRYRLGNSRSYALKRILNFSINSYWSYLDLGKSLIIVINLALVQGLNSIAVCISGSWKRCIFRGNWHLKILGVVGKMRDWIGEEVGGVHGGYGWGTVGRIRGRGRAGIWGAYLPFSGWS